MYFPEETVFCIQHVTQMMSEIYIFLSLARTAIGNKVFPPPLGHLKLCIQFKNLENKERRKAKEK